MSKVKQIFREYWLVIFFAILLSFVTASPQIYFRIEHRTDGVYQGIELLPDSPWSARVREVQDGHPNFGSIYYHEGKNNPYLFQPLGSMVVAYLGSLFNLDINDTLSLSRFLLPFLAFFLVYIFVFLLSRDKLVSLCCSSLLLFADSILNFSGLSRLFHGLSPDNFLRIARPVNPAMIYILLFGFLISFWLFCQKRDWRFGAFSSVLLGLNFYNYFYSWTYLFAFGGFLGLFFLFQRRWKEALRIMAVYIGSLFVAVPYGLNFYRIINHPGYLETSFRNGVVFTHMPLFVGFFVLLGLFVFLWGFPHDNKDKYFLGLSLLLAPFVTMNQQILTGKVLQAAHYHWFFHKPMAIIFILIVVFGLLSSRNLIFYRKSLAVMIITLSIFTGIFVQANSYLYDVRDGGEIAVERQKYGPIMKWLNENGGKDSIVLSNDEISHLVVIYTPFDVFYHRAAMYSLTATRSRLLDVLFSFYRLRGVSSIDVRKIFFAERGYISSNIYGMYYRELYGSYEAIPDDEIDDIVTLYKETLTISRFVWLEEILEKYKVEYLVWDKRADPSWNLGQYPFLEEAAIFGDVAIYQFSQ
ncbi:MAG TPA: hypothetical protein P5274_00125 [Candidatus Paceibacterota bacterium]|nr:hypothetical protein [Candidatus Paceibacterota bacterium]